MTENSSGPVAEQPQSRWPAWLWLAGGTIASVIIFGTAESMLPRSTSLTLAFRALMLVGIALSCAAYWRASRYRAGDDKRAELVGIIAFSSLAAVIGRSTSDLFMQGAWLDNIWNTLQIALAFGFGVTVTKWLYGVDAREAADTAKRKKEGVVMSPINAANMRKAHVRVEAGTAKGRIVLAGC